MYKRHYWWKKPLIALGIAFWTFCGGIGFGFLLDWMIGVIG